MFKAAFFDLDGTLQDSEVIWVEATRLYLAEHGASLSGAEATALVYGRAFSDVYVGMVRYLPALAEKGFDTVAAELRPRYARLCTERDISLPGSIALLRKMALKMPVAVVSGSTRHDIFVSVERLGIKSLLSFYLGSEDYPRGKPHPGCYLMAAARLALPPEQCVVFEDSHVGVVSAKAAGMFCVGLRRSEAPPQDISLADCIVSDLSLFDFDNP